MTHYREILKEVFTYRSIMNQSYSMRSFANNLGMPISTLSNILNANRNMSYQCALKIVDRLKLDDDQRLKFLKSVFHEESPHAYVPEDQDFHHLASPLHFAILSCLKVKDDEQTIQSFARKLNAPEKDIEKAIDGLLNANIIEKKDKGYFRRHDKVMFPDGISPQAQKKFHEQILKQAIDSLDKSNEERFVSHKTLAINPRHVNKAIKRIKKFHHDMEELLEDGDLENVYHLEVALFPHA